MIAILLPVGTADDRVEAFSTERLVIRQLGLGDDAFVLQLLNEKEFLRFIGDKGVRTLDDARAYLVNGPIASYAANGFGLFLVAEKVGGSPVGMCGLLLRDDQSHPDVGFAFLADFQARGYAFESAAAVMEYGHRQLQIETIVAFVNPNNARSIRLLERLGFDFAGEGSLAGIETPQNLYSSSQSS